MYGSDDEGTTVARRGWLGRLTGRAGGPGDEFATKMDREATADDLDALVAFARTHVGVEFYVEPETMATDTTAVAVAADGEWIRRRVGSPRRINRIARQLGCPIYDAQVRGYPQRMRDWTSRNRDRQRL